MDPNEIMRLMRIIRDNGHVSGFLPKTKEELDATGAAGIAEAVLGKVPTIPYDATTHKTLACTVLLIGETPTMPDNRTGPCAWLCGRTVQFRPWVPPEMETVCLYCLAERKAEDN